VEPFIFVYGTLGFCGTHFGNRCARWKISLLKAKNPTKFSSKSAKMVTLVTFSDSGSAPVSKFWNPNLFKSENSTPIQAPANIDAIKI